MPGPRPPHPMRAVPNFSDGGTCGAPKTWRGRIVAAVAPVADLARKLLRVCVEGIFFIRTELGEGFAKKLGFTQKPWQALIAPNLNFPHLTSTIPSVLLFVAVFNLTKE